MGFHGFPQSSQVNSGIMPYITQWPLFPTAFPIHYSLSSLEAACYELPAAWLIKLQTEQVGKAVTNKARIQKVLGSNIGWKILYPHLGVSQFSLNPPDIRGKYLKICHNHFHLNPF
jgi:hypothetical protein